MLIPFYGLDKSTVALATTTTTARVQVLPNASSSAR